MFVNRLTLLRSCALACVVLATLPAVARAESGLQPLESIRARAQATLRGVIDPGVTGLELQAVPLDPRLRFANCTRQLEGFAQLPRGNQARATVRVSCSSPAWSINVPVEIRRSHAVLVLRRAVARGETLSAADVQSQTRVLPGLGSPFVSSADQLAGRTTRRPLPEGTALTADALTAALLIHRGQTVTLLANSAGFEVRAPGRAMADAAVNQRVRVQNLNSLKIVEGLADKEGVVRVLP
jgi:flagella basal body P-ring formation protein FlgA